MHEFHNWFDERVLGTEYLHCKGDVLWGPKDGMGGGGQTDIDAQVSRIKIDK